MPCTTWPWSFRESEGCVGGSDRANPNNIHSNFDINEHWSNQVLCSEKAAVYSKCLYLMRHTTTTSTVL